MDKTPKNSWKNRHGEEVNRFTDWGDDTIEIIMPDKGKQEPQPKAIPKGKLPPKKK